MSNIIQMPNTGLSPEVLLHQILSHAADIESMVVTVKYKGDGFSTFWSVQPVSDLCMASMVTTTNVQNILLGSRTDE
jgi:hypothetical protein